MWKPAWKPPGAEAGGPAPLPLLWPKGTGPEESSLTGRKHGLLQDLAPGTRLTAELGVQGFGQRCGGACRPALPPG